MVFKGELGEQEELEEGLILWMVLKGDLGELEEGLI